MIIMKFGGTSVGSAARIAATSDIIAATQKPVVVVLSAMSGITNKLIEISEGRSSRGDVLSHHMQAARELGIMDRFENPARKIIEEARTSAEIVACGELLSTRMAVDYMQSCNMDAVLLPALDFMRINSDREPDTEAIAAGVRNAIENTGEHDIYITQGFICRDADGDVATLSRGGSDYTATLLGEALGAQEVQIWTDVDGVYTADPRRVPNARRIPRMSYRQATHAARCGAKILHQDCVVPAERAMYTLRVLDSFHPDAPGTNVADYSDAEGFFAVAAAAGPVINLVGSRSDVSEKDIKHALKELCGCSVEIHDGYASVGIPPEKINEAMQTLHSTFITITE